MKEVENRNREAFITSEIGALPPFSLPVQAQDLPRSLISANRREVQQRSIFKAESGNAKQLRPVQEHDLQAYPANEGGW